MEGEYREVRFDQYCINCKYKNEPETFDICDECLSNPANIDSDRPINFKVKD